MPSYEQHLENLFTAAQDERDELEGVMTDAEQQQYSAMRRGLILPTLTQYKYAWQDAIDEDLERFPPPRPPGYREDPRSPEQIEAGIKAQCKANEASYNDLSGIEIFRNVNGRHGSIRVANPVEIPSSGVFRRAS